MSRYLLPMAAHGGGGAWQSSQTEVDYAVARMRRRLGSLISAPYYSRRTGLVALGGVIRAESPSVAVFNTCSWDRSAMVEVPVPVGFPENP